MWLTDHRLRPPFDMLDVYSLAVTSLLRECRDAKEAKHTYPNSPYAPPCCEVWAEYGRSGDLTREGFKNGSKDERLRGGVARKGHWFIVSE